MCLRTNINLSPVALGTPASCRQVSGWLAALFVFAFAVRVGAHPQGMTVGSGTATITVNGSQADITASRNAFLNWQSFNIAPGETTTFHQPDAASIVWNRINDPNPSQIWGHLNANGIVVLMNQSGFYFGPGSVVNAAGFVATTATTLPDFNGSASWQFNGPPPLASIINFGEIKVNSGGSAFLIAEKIENHGVLMAPDGTLGLYAGKEVLMSERPDGRGLSVQVTLPEGSVDNQGKLIADAGSILLNARTVNQNGLLQANSVQQRNGIIELVASDAVNLGAGSSIVARGDETSVSGGGQVTIKSDNTFSDAAGSVISVAGGVPGGNGGEVELSAPFMPSIESRVDGAATAGYAGGKLFIDPKNIVLGSSGTGSAGSGTVNANDPPVTGTLTLNVNSAFIGLSQIKLQATANITLQTGTIWDLAASTGISASGSLLSLEAGGDIILQNFASIRAGDGWSVSLAAGRNFATPDAVTPGVGNITFQGDGSIEARDGSISLLAGRNITVASGFVRTVNGGGIDVTAVSGSINTGTKANGFQFLPSSSVALNDYMLVDPNLGGISTAAGGNVNLTAGVDITSLLPTGVQTSASDGGSGAFGAAPGNVTLNAGGNVTGHYVVRNGVGTINAGLNAGTLSRNLALSLVSGGWDVTAGHDVILQEVRNPNGIFNSLGLANSPTKHYFDYSPDAYVNLNGGNAVQLLGANVPRKSGLFEQGIPSIYAPSLDITAGAGGVSIGNNVLLFPSPVGQLHITTTGGGSLTGTKAGDLTQLVMSDSSRSQYSVAGVFGADDHAAVPLHVNEDPEDPSKAVTLTISGNMNNMLLAFPKHADISIGDPVLNKPGNMVNCRFDIQNLHSDDVTTLTVFGDVLNRNEFTDALSARPDFSPFDRVDPTSLPTGMTVADLSALANRFSYDSTAQTLTFQGRMTSAELKALVNLRAQKLNPLFGTPEVDDEGNPIYEPVAVLNATVAQTLFDHSQDIPLNPNTGYVINGPGTLNFTARNLDLGATLGIQSVGARDNHALAPLGPFGSAINVNLTGNLDMFSTTISSLAGGDVSVSALGTINVGSATFAGNDSVARGIFTVAKSDVTVIARGDINVAGSRIAAYDGGNVRVLSLEGDIDAGRGAAGAVAVEKVIVVPVEDPVTHVVTYDVRTYTPTIPLSGILAATFPPSLDPNFPSSDHPVGSINVEAPRGNVTANGGGIVQLSLNGKYTADSKINVVAGTSEKIAVLRDANGDVILDEHGKPIPALDGDGNFILDSSDNGVVYATHPGDIDCSGAGVIGYFVNLTASRNIRGVIFSTRDINFSAGGSADVTAIAGGGIVGKAESLTGILVGNDGVNTDGATGDGLKTLSQDGGSGFAQANAAGATSQGAASASEEESKKVVAQNGDEEGDDKKKRSGNGNAPILVKRVGRVTVILPKS